MKSKGMTLVEIILAITILSIIAFSVLNIFTSGYQNIYTAGHASRHSYDVLSEMEKARIGSEDEAIKILRVAKEATIFDDKKIKYQLLYSENFSNAPTDTIDYRLFSVSVDNKDLEMNPDNLPFLSKNGNFIFNVGDEIVALDSLIQNNTNQTYSDSSGALLVIPDMKKLDENSKNNNQALNWNVSGGIAILSGGFETNSGKDLKFKSDNGDVFIGEGVTLKGKSLEIEANNVLIQPEVNIETNHEIKIEATQSISVRGAKLKSNKDVSLKAEKEIDVRGLDGEYTDLKVTGKQSKINFIGTGNEQDPTIIFSNEWTRFKRNYDDIKATVIGSVKIEGIEAKFKKEGGH